MKTYEYDFTVMTCIAVEAESREEADKKYQKIVDTLNIVVAQDGDKVLLEYDIVFKPTVTEVPIE